MTTRILLVSLALSLTLVSVGLSQGKGRAGGQNGAMPVYVTPFYNSKGLSIDVGKRSKALEKADARSILGIAKEMGKQRQTLRPEEMFVLAIRLYDLGHKDEAVYWFYAGQFRARLFTALLDPAHVGGIGSEAFELKQAYNAFQQLAGTYINGYAFGKLPALQTTLAKVKEEGEEMPDFQKLFPEVKFVPAATWPERNQKIAAGLQGLIDHIEANGESIKQQRKQAGLEGKY